MDTLIGDSYDPQNIAVLRNPDQFPPWLRRVLWIFSVAAGAAWGASYLLPGTISRSVADGTTNNVFTAAAAALVGAAVVFVAQSSLRRQRTRSAHPYFLRVVRGCFALDAWLEGKLKGVTAEFLGIVAEGIDRNMEKLQHIIADPLAARHKRDLLTELEPLLARPGRTVQPQQPDRAVSDASPSIERRLRLQATINVMLDRVIKVYSDGESFLKLDYEEVLPPDLFPRLPDRTDQPRAP